MSRSDLVTSHINLVLPLLPITVKSVSLFGVVPSLAVGKSRPTNALTQNLRRLASLESLHIFSYHAFPKTRNPKADLELQNAVARLVLGQAFKNLSSFFINIGRSELPQVALGQLARAVPTLKHLGVATQNLTDRELKEVAVALPELESLAIAPWLKTNLSTGEWKFAHTKRFGEYVSSIRAWSFLLRTRILTPFFTAHFYLPGSARNSTRTLATVDALCPRSSTDTPTSYLGSRSTASSSPCTSSATTTFVHPSPFLPYQPSFFDLY